MGLCTKVGKEGRQLDQEALWVAVTPVSTALSPLDKPAQEGWAEPDSSYQGRLAAASSEQQGEHQISSEEPPPSPCRSYQCFHPAFFFFS